MRHPRPHAAPRVAKRRGSAAYSALLICILLSVSQALSPFPFFAVLVLLAGMLVTRVATLKTSYWLLAAALLLLSVAGLAADFNLGQTMRVAITCLLLLMLGSLNYKRQTAALEAATRFAVLSVAMCLIGFVYAVLGGPALGAIDNPDGRQALVFLTTISNSIYPFPTGTVIRPSFIYDEPGAYAFVLDAVLIARFLVHKQLRRDDWILLVGGMLTFSIAHVLVFFLLLIAAGKGKWGALPIAMLAALDYYIYVTIDYSLFFRRLTLEDGALTGDNRSGLFVTAVDLLQRYPNGVGSICNWDIAACINRFGGFGENPAFPAAFYGLPASLAYYVILGTLLVMAVTSLRWKGFLMGLAIAALIMQRPFLFSLGYNALIVVLFSMYASAYSLRPRRTLPCRIQPLAQLP